MTGEQDGQVWLGRVGSGGVWVASGQLLGGPGGARRGSSISRNAQGQMAIAGIQTTDLLDFTEPVGFVF